MNDDSNYYICSEDLRNLLTGRQTPPGSIPEKCMLHPNPAYRLSIDEVLAHKWLNDPITFTLETLQE